MRKKVRIKMDDKWKCPKCGSTNVELHCNDCKDVLYILQDEPDHLRCKKCGTRLYEDMEWCWHCGFHNG